jgi:hypothetical protein
MVLTNLCTTPSPIPATAKSPHQLDARQLRHGQRQRHRCRRSLGRVFERHYRGPESTGAGIGLSLVKRICDRLGWPSNWERPIPRTTPCLRFAQS